MMILNHSKFVSLVEKDERILTNAFVYSFSRSVDFKDEEEGTSIGDNQLLLPLLPPEDLVNSYVNGDINKKKFRRAYKKHLKSRDNQMLIYMIARSFNEKKYMPIFVCSDEEYEIGYAQVFAKYLKKTFGMKLVHPKEYRAAVKEAWKEAKQNKKKRRNKAFVRLLREFVKDNLQMSLDGLEELKHLERKFAIDRVAILINRSDDPMEEISKKDIYHSIKLFQDGGKKQAKLIKAARKELGLSKNPERWSKRDMISLVMDVYARLHPSENEDSSDNN